MCGCALSIMLLTLAVVLTTPQDYSGTFQGWYSARLTAWRFLKGVRRALHLLKWQTEGTNTQAHEAAPPVVHDNVVIPWLSCDP